ncbi:MAG: FkbM family methyltransferase [Verrucomicrobiota bacterium]
MKPAILHGLFRYASRFFSQTEILESLLSVISPHEVNAVVRKKLGFGNYEDFTVSGEQFFIDVVLTQTLPRGSGIVFDCGAHKGEFARLLVDLPGLKTLYAFEPIPASREILRDAMSNFENVQIVDLAISDCPGTLEFRVSSSNPCSKHASIYEEAQLIYNKGGEFVSVPAEAISLDEFSSEHGIDQISFLKLDLEGHEKHALEGANKLLSKDSIDVIQIEFTHLNVATKVFLKDLWDLVPRYKMFRLAENELIPLGGYDPFHEVFQYHNLVAISPQAAIWCDLPKVG